MGLGNHLIQALNVQMRKLKFPITWILYFYYAEKGHTRFSTSQKLHC